MNNYKVGDRVWYDGYKLVITSIELDKYLQVNDDYYVLLCDVKPILKVKNGVICENN